MPTRCLFHFGYEAHLAVVPRVGDTMSLLNVRHCVTDELGREQVWFNDVRGRVTDVIWMKNLPGMDLMAKIVLDPSNS